MFISLLKVLKLMLLCSIGALASAANQSAQETAAPIWSMLIDTSAPEFSTRAGKLRERMTLCRAGRAVLYRDTGMTRIIVEPLNQGNCRWKLSIETEGSKASFVCSPPVGPSPLPTFFFSTPSAAELARLRCEPAGSGQSPTPREDRVLKV